MTAAGLLVARWISRETLPRERTAVTVIVVAPR